MFTRWILVDAYYIFIFLLSSSLSLYLSPHLFYLVPLSPLCRVVSSDLLLFFSPFLQVHHFDLSRIGQVELIDAS